MKKNKHPSFGSLKWFNEDMTLSDVRYDRVACITFFWNDAVFFQMFRSSLNNNSSERLYQRCHTLQRNLATHH